MTTTLKKIALTDHPPTAKEGLLHEQYLGLVGHIEIVCTVRIGTITLTIDAFRQLTVGQQLTLQQQTDEPVDILVNDQLIARGELMSCDDHFAIHITDVAS